MELGTLRFHDYHDVDVQPDSGQFAPADIAPYFSELNGKIFVQSAVCRSGLNSPLVAVVWTLVDRCADHPCQEWIEPGKTSIRRIMLKNGR